jgi:hypothetical protein
MPASHRVSSALVFLGGVGSDFHLRYVALSGSAPVYIDVIRSYYKYIPTVNTHQMALRSPITMH